MSGLVVGAYDRYIVAFSGGKDSLACVLYLLDIGIHKNNIELWHHDVDGGPGSPRFMDWPVTRSYCQRIADALQLPIYFSWREGGFMREMMRDQQATAQTTFEYPAVYLGDRVSIKLRRSVGGKGKPGTRLKFPQVSADLSVRWCSAYLKIDVMRRGAGGSAGRGVDRGSVCEAMGNAQRRVQARRRTNIMFSEERTNERRASAAFSVVHGYGGNGDQKNSIKDLLTDIMHLCRQEEYDFDAMLNMSRLHFQAEIEEET